MYPKKGYVFVSKPQLPLFIYSLARWQSTPVIDNCPEPVLEEHPFVGSSLRLAHIDDERK